MIRNQRGDTIIEVLIAMAVASSMLALTYGSMNRNLAITQASQERSEATKLAQGQIEALKAVTDVSEPVQNKFCFSTSGVLTSGFSPGVPVAALASENFNGYPGACNQEGIYFIAISRISTKNYRIYVRWDRVGGSGYDQIIMAYRTVR